MTDSYETRGGVRVECSVEAVDGARDLAALTAALDTRRGVLLASSYEYPGRYTRWDMGFVDPPLVLVARGREVEVTALNDRGGVLLAPIAAALEALPATAKLARDASALRCLVREPEGRFAEEERSRQPSVFSVLRALVDLFGSAADAHLGLYGAFGYDLALQFEPVRRRLERPVRQRDFVLYLPDELLLVDHRREVATRRRYEFAVGAANTRGMARSGASRPYRGSARVERSTDHAPGEYAAIVRTAKESFRRGDLFEVVPGQTFFEPAPDSPATVFGRLRIRNPAPFNVAGTERGTQAAFTRI